MIYLDNAATSFPKPRGVLADLNFCLKKCCGNAGRSSHALSLKTAEMIYDSREEIAKLLGQGYKPGKTTQIATSTMQLCLSKIQMAINARWSQVNPRIGAEGYVLIAVRFNSAGQMVNCRLSESCGDKTSDSAALTVVRSVGPIAGLDKEFLREFGKQDLVIRYKVVAR